MKEALKAFKVLSDPTRLRVLSLVLERECCVCEILQALEISQSKASRALTSLYDAGFLKMRKEGLWSLYSTDENMEGYLRELVAAVQKVMKDNKIAILDSKRLKNAQRTGLTCPTTGCEKASVA